MPLELGISTAFFIHEGFTPDKLRRLANSTVKNVEVAWHYQNINLTPIIADQTAQVLLDNGIICHSLHAPFGEMCNSAAVKAEQKASTRDTYSQCLNYLQVLGGKILVVHPSFGIKEYEREERLKHAIESFAWLAGECEKNGTYLAVENLHHQQLGNTAAELDKIIGALKAKKVGICFDFAHAFVSEGAEQTVRNLKSPIITIHLCDNTHPKLESTCWPMAPQGLVGWKAVFRELKNKGYNGVMMYEIYNDARPDPNNDGIQQLEQNYQELMHIFEIC